MAAYILQEKICFVGNPGGGKSTLLNCLMKQRDSKLNSSKFFKSGVCIGSGMTYKLDERNVGATTFLDTPGLEDIEKRKQAAASITEALKKNGNYQIIFVVTLEAGRVRPSDVTTINLVLRSAKEISHYGVIFNKLGKKVYKKIMESKDEKMKLQTQVALQVDENNMKKAVPYELFLQEYDELKDEDDVTTEIPELQEFLDRIPFLVIHKENVIDVPYKTFEEENAKMEKQLSVLTKDKEEMIRQREADKIKFQRTLDEIRQKQEEKFRREIESFREKQDRIIATMHAEHQREREESERRRRQDNERHQREIISIENKSKENRNQMQSMMTACFEMNRINMEASNKRHEKQMKEIGKHASNHKNENIALRAREELQNYKRTSNEHFKKESDRYVRESGEREKQISIQCEQKIAENEKVLRDEIHSTQNELEECQRTSEEHQNKAKLNESKYRVRETQLRNDYEKRIAEKKKPTVVQYEHMDEKYIYHPAPGVLMIGSASVERLSIQ